VVLINLLSNLTSMYELLTKCCAETLSSSTVETWFKCWVTLSGDFNTKTKPMKLNTSSVRHNIIRMRVLWSDWKVIPCSYATPYCFNCGNLCATCCYGISTSHLVPLHSHVYGHEVLDKITLCFWSTVTLSNFDWFLWNKRHCKEHWILNSIICTFPGFGII